MTVSKFVGLHGAPRSGTSWIGQIFNSSQHVAYRYQPFFAHAFRGRVDSSATWLQIDSFVKDLVSTEDDFVLQRSSASLAASNPLFTKASPTHLVYKEVRFHQLIPHLLATYPAFAAIGIVRDPRSVLASWKNAPREFNSTWSFDSQWRNASLKNAAKPENWYGFQRWKELALSFLSLQSLYPDRFHIVRYEDIIASPLGVASEIFSFLDLPLEQQTREFILLSSLRNDLDPYGVFRQHSLIPRASASIDAAIGGEIVEELMGTPLSVFVAS